MNTNSTWTTEEFRTIIDALAPRFVTKERGLKEVKRRAWDRVKSWLETGRWVYRAANQTEQVAQGAGVWNLVVANTLQYTKVKPSALPKNLRNILAKYRIRYTNTGWQSPDRMSKEDALRALGDENQLERDRTEKRLECHETRKRKVSRLIRRHERAVEARKSPLDKLNEKLKAKYAPW